MATAATRADVRRRLAVVTLSGVLVAASGCGGAASDEDLPSSATRMVAAGSSVYHFTSAGELAATSTHVVRGQVTEVQPGAEVRYQDGSGQVITPRLLVMRVDEYLFSRDATSPNPAEIRVHDGYWEDGEGYGHEEMPWVQSGDSVVLFVSRDRAGDGSILDTYTPLGTHGRVILEEERPRYDSSADSIWADLGERASLAELEAAIDSAVGQAKSGEARPVLVPFCYPSVPGDEDSEPICKKV